MLPAYNGTKVCADNHSLIIYLWRDWCYKLTVCEACDDLKGNGLGIWSLVVYQASVRLQCCVACTGFFCKAIYPFSQSLKAKLGPQCCSVSYPGGIIHSLGRKCCVGTEVSEVQIFSKLPFFFLVWEGRSNLCIDYIVFNKLTELCGIMGFNHS